MAGRFLATVSLVGTLLGLSLWGLSYLDLTYGKAENAQCVGLLRGGLVYRNDNAAAVISSLPRSAGSSGPLNPYPAFSNGFPSFQQGLPASTPPSANANDGPWSWRWGEADSWLANHASDAKWWILARPNEHLWIVPLWIPTVGFVLLFACTRILVKLDRRRRRRLGLCETCGYDLRGCAKSRCPECNTAFDPQRVQRERERNEARAVRAAEWLRRYDASFARRSLATLAQVGTFACAVLWFVSCFGIEYRGSTVVVRASRGNVIVYPSPSEVVYPERWAVEGLTSLDTVWWLHPFLSGSTLYVPVCLGTFACGLLWLLIYRPLYRSRWRGAEETYRSAADLSVGGGMS